MTVCKLKICGICDPLTAYNTAKLGVDYIGLVFAPQSKRYVTVEAAIPIAEEVRRGGAIPVAVFTEATSNEMQAICKKTGINHVQLHGDTSRLAHKHLPICIHRLFVLHVNESGKVINNAQYIDSSLDIKRDYLLFDGIHGGSGKRIILDNIKHYKSMRYFIAGGITPHNVTTLLNEVTPYGIDLSSGVEKAPAVKDLSRIQLILEHLKVNNHEHYI